MPVWRVRFGACQFDAVQFDASQFGAFHFVFDAVSSHSIFISLDSSLD